MNIQSLQLPIGMVNRSAPSGGGRVEAASGAFGALLQQITGNEKMSLSVERQVDPEVLQLIQSVLQVTTPEQLAEIISEQPITENDAKESIEQKDIVLLLAQLGVELPQVEENDITVGLLIAIEQSEQPFFEELQSSLEGKGNLSEKQVLAIVVELKKMVLHSPENADTWEQQRAIHTVQEYLNSLEKQLNNLEKQSNSSEKQFDTMEQTAEDVRLSIQSYEGRANLKVTPDQDLKLHVDSVHEKVTLPKNDKVEEVKSVAMQPITSFKNTQTIEQVDTRQRQENVMRELQMIFKRSNFGQTGGAQRLLIKLYPEQLGQIRIELLQSDGMLTARILTTTTLGKELLDSQLTQLRNAFIQQNVQVERIDISQSIQQPYKSDRDQSFHEQFGREQQETTDEQQNNDEEELSFEEYLLEVEV